MGSRGTVNMETEKAITGVVAFFVTSVCKKSASDTLFALAEKR